VAPIGRPLSARQQRSERRSSARRGGEDPAVLLLMWGDLFEDFHDTIDVTLEDFCSSYSGSWLFGYVDALASAGVRTTLLHVSNRVTSTERLVHRPSGTPVVILPAPRRHAWLRHLYRRFRRKSLSSLASYASLPVLRLVGEVRRSRAGILLTQEYEHARFDLLVGVGWLLGRPVYATFQGGDAPHSRLERSIRGRTVRAAAGLIIASRRERERVNVTYRVPEARIAAIPNAIDAAAVEPLDRTAARDLLAIDQDARVVEWHGRVTIRRKGLDVLLAAWAMVYAQRPEEDLVLLLVGTGDDAEDFRRLIEATGLHSIRWRDQYVSDRSELLVYQSAADIYVLPSRHEGFAVAPIEAMAAGLPVVAADAPGIEDLFPGGERSGGIVVPREDAEALAEALGRLIDEQAVCREIGARARERAERHYSLEAVGDQLRAFLLRPPREVGRADASGTAG
jgi:glycosyltransferase involved in cell wall biosynthesis